MIELIKNYDDNLLYNFLNVKVYKFIGFKFDFK